MLNNKKLSPICTYQGGKQRYSKEIVDIIYSQNNIDENTKFYDLCCGSGAISLEMINRGFNPKNITMVDKSVWGDLWFIVGNDSFNLEKFKSTLDKVPDDKYLIQNYVKMLSQDEVDADYIYKYIILQSCSFGGKQIDIINNKWVHSGFRNYWQPTETSIRKSPVNPMQPSKDELLKRVEQVISNCKGVNGVKNDIENIKNEIISDSIVYIDPPYKNTTGYNHDLNIAKYTNVSKKVYISEACSLTQDSIELNLKGSKGGITAKKNKRVSEWLNCYNN